MGTFASLKAKTNASVKVNINSGLKVFLAKLCIGVNIKNGLILEKWSLKLLISNVIYLQARLYTLVTWLKNKNK